MTDMGWHVATADIDMIKNNQSSLLAFFASTVRILKLNLLMFRNSLVMLHQFNFLRMEDGGQKRVKILTPEQRAAISSLTDPAQVPIEERRRQYNAINRRLNGANADKNFPPGLVEKWRDANDSQKKFLAQNFFINRLFFRKPISEPEEF